MKTIQEWLRSVETSEVTHEDLRRLCYYGISETERRHLHDNGFRFRQGKVRDVVEKDGKLWLFHTDRLSAFDRYVGMVPFKGSILAALTEYWFQAVSSIVPTHFIRRCDERVLEVQAMTPIPVEVVVSGYLSGPILKAYERGERVFGNSKLHDDMEHYQALPELVVQPTIKAENIKRQGQPTIEQLIHDEFISAADWQQMADLAQKLFVYGQEIFLQHGWLLVDAKYEFGRSQDGTIHLIDEIHTPDSAHLWLAKNYEQRLRKGASPEILDKDLIRRLLQDQGFTGEGEVPDIELDNFLVLATAYLRVAESLIGHALLSAGPVKSIPYLKELLPKAPKPAGLTRSAQPPQTTPH